MCFFRVSHLNICETRTSSPQEPAKVVSGGASSAASDAGVLNMLSAAPPCGSYLQLVLLSSLPETLGQLAACTSETEIKEVIAKFTLLKAPIADLISVCKKAQSDIATARKPKAVAKKAAKETAAPATASVTLFEAGPKLLKDVPSVSETETVAAIFSPDVPCIVRATPDVNSKFEDQEKIKEVLDNFLALISTPEAKTVMKKGDGRTQLTIDDDAASDLIIARAKKLFPNVKYISDLGEIENPGVKASLTTCTFGMLPNSETFAWERAYASYVRLSSGRGSGYRKVVFLRLVPFVSWMGAQMKKDPSGISDIDIRSKLKFLNEAELTDYLASSEKALGYHATISNTDSLFIPPGFLFAERSSVEHNVIGYRMGVITDDGDGIRDLKQVDEWKTKNGTKNELLSAFVQQFEVKKG